MCQKAGCPAVLRKGWLPAFGIFLGQTGAGGGGRGRRWAFILTFSECILLSFKL